MQSKITLMGMYNFDNSLFEKLTFPSGINADLAISRILEKSEEFELVYSDFGYLKERIGIWGKLWERTFDKWIKALQVEYDPLYNYDRTEEYTDTRGREYADKKSDSRADSQNSESSMNSSSASNTVTGSSSGSTTEQKVSAYDSSSYSEKEKEEGSAHTLQTGSGDSTASSDSTANSNAISQGVSDASGTSNEIVKHAAHLYGNIGVTTSQQMLKDELDIAAWNLYEHISDIFIDEFCILVY